MKILSVAVMVIILVSCGSGDQGAGEVATPLAQTKNTNAFSESFSDLLTNYFHLKDNLVLSNDSLAIASANLLIGSAERLKLDDLKADSSIVLMAKSSAETIVAEAKGLVGEKDIEGKRKSFQMISDNMYDLIRTVRYDKEVVYHQFCPMAFNDAGAYWLSKTSDIKNPYFGKKMLTCGEVKDLLDFRGK